MKKTFIFVFLLFNAIISLITAASYCYVSGNTFTIPSDNKESNPYHTYKINKSTDNIQNNKNNNTHKNNNLDKNNSIQKDNSLNININNNNTQDNNANNNIKNKHYYNRNKNSGKNRINKVIQTYNKTSKKPYRKKTLKKQKTNNITKIEFQKHFIKIKAGSSENILFTTTPVKSSHANLLYKSNNNSIAVYKNNKLTGIKKGFTTILIMLKNRTVKAACPIKVI